MESVSHVSPGPAEVPDEAYVPTEVKKKDTPLPPFLPMKPRERHRPLLTRPLLGVDWRLT